MTKTLKASLKKRIALTLAALMLMTLLFAIGGTATGSAETEPPFEITIMTRMGAAEPPAADNAVIAEIERITNTKLKIEWVPAAAYTEKLNAVVASNDYPMLTLFGGGGKPETIEVEAVRAGIFWKVGDYLMDYENLSQLDSTIIQNASIDGELWGMFRTRPSVRNGLYYRSDWAEALGLEPPKNVEELYQMLKAFVEQDPDGNGIADTYGLAQESYLRLVFSMLSPAFGLGSGYEIEDGKLVATLTKPGYLEMLKFIKRLYDDGLMNRDFPTVNESKRDEMMADNYGMAITSIDKGDGSLVPLQKLHPGANFTVMVDFADVDMPIHGRSGFDSKFYISRKAVPDEANVLRIMDYFNDMYSAEINNLVYNGIEGIHYDKVDDTSITISEEQAARFIVEVNPMEQLAFRYTKYNYQALDQPSYTAQVQYFFNNYEVDLAVDPTFTLSSEVSSEKGPELEQQIWDAGVKFVTGAIDENGWWAEVERWRKNGGDQMVAEYQAAYDAE